MTDSEKLGIACRFEGVEAVRTLLKKGAKFDAGAADPIYDGDYAVSLLNVSKQLRHGAYHLNRIELGGEFTDSSGKKYTLLPTSERIEIYELLKENAKKCGFDSGRLFYYAILANDTETIAAMRENGEAFPGYIAEMLAKGGRNADWSEFCYTFEGMDAEEFFAVIGNISRELGGKINFSEILFCCVVPIIYTPEGLEFILERFDQQKMKKGWLMKRFIDEGEVGLLEVVARHGWLKMPKKRDEMIQYASDNGKTEALAFLMDFKNRTADLAKEREAAEKRMLRELNANPNSVTELKKSWGFVKNADGTITITCYKGNRTDVIVPGKIGKDTVTEIGEAAFTGSCMYVRNYRRELPGFRQTITSVKLPESIESIGGRAFAYCLNLLELNIPPNVGAINKSAFDDCPKLTVMVVKGSYAEKYCKENQIKYKEST